MDTAAKNVRVGITTDELDKIVHEVGTDYKCDLSTFMFLIIYLFIIFKTWKCLTQHRLVSVDSCIITLTLIPDDETTEHVLDSEKKTLKKWTCVCNFSKQDNTCLRLLNP